MNSFLRFVRGQRQRWVAMWGFACVLAMAAAAPLHVLAQTPTADLEPALDRIARETAAIRELPPLDDIDDVLLTQDELVAMMPGLLATDIDPEEIVAESRALAALGLIPPDLDLLDLMTRLLGEQAAGFYDPLTDEMIVVAQGDFDAEEYFYSHEVVHALQDAHLDPADLMEETDNDNSDEVQARLALYEGDAVSASDSYLANHPDLGLALLRESAGNFTEIDQAPGAISALLIFPYLEGPKFVDRLRAEGGWDAVDAAYLDLPTSTEQILHPTKYIDRDNPVSVPLPNLDDALGASWESVFASSLGELQVALLLADFAPGESVNLYTGEIAFPEAARNAAAGWDGDHFALWEGGEGGDEVLIWRSAWDTPQDARAFSRALAQFNESRWDGVFNGESPDDVALITDEIAARIVLRGQEVFFVQSPTLPLTDAALAAVEDAAAPDPAPGPE